MRYSKNRYHSKTKSKKKTVTRLLEVGTLESLKSAKQRTADLIDYHWEYYSCLASQRQSKLDQIKAALNLACISDFKFDGWQRATKYKFSLHPLSTVGSLSFIGGRFNVGKEVNVNVPSFASLYLASDKDTALQETLGQSLEKQADFTPLEIALSNKQSEAVISISGKLDKVLDLRSPKSLTGFVNIIKKFKISKKAEQLAKQLNFDKPDVIQTSKQLLDSLLDANWNFNPVNLDVPANSQIFGYLIYLAEIEGILYPSKLTGKDCLAIFPVSFKSSDSYLILDDETPHPKVPTRIDSTNYILCDYTFEDLATIHGSEH